MQNFMLGSCGQGCNLVNQQMPMHTEGSIVCVESGRAVAEPASIQIYISMAREGIVLFVLDGTHGNPVIQRLQQDSPCEVIVMSIGGDMSPKSIGSSF